MADTSKHHVGDDAILGTIEAFTNLDQSGDRAAMNKLAQRLGKDQPALLQFAAQVKFEHGDSLGEAAVFYGTLVWAMFERQFGKQLPRLTPENLVEAKKIIDEETAAVAGFAEKPVQDRMAPGLTKRQPQLTAKLVELIAEDVKEAALTVDGAAIIFPPTQAIAEAFDAAVTNRRPGLRLGPVVRDEPKVGRNEPCTCGSGKKFKRCHGAAA